MQQTNTKTKEILKDYHVESIDHRVKITPIEQSKLVKSFPEISSLDQSNIKNSDTSKKITQALEDGYVVLFPNLKFEIKESEQEILTPDVCNGRSKNVGYSVHTKKLSGTKVSDELKTKITSMMSRYAEFSKDLLKTVCPYYEPNIEQKRTSFRPVEIKGRIPRNYTEDDTRLHVDAFPMNPTSGNRILRVFANINPDNKPRTWRLGEPFETLIEKFVPNIKPLSPVIRHIMKMLGITKSYRTDYDQIMLKLHNNMKHDLNYQRSAPQEIVEMPANAVWVVYTDKASHGVLEGQHLLEQTYYIDPDNMLEPNKSPLYILEKYLGKSLR